MGYTQGAVADWIQADRPNYNKKEKGVVTLTADEFIAILQEFSVRGPGPKAPKKIPEEASRFLQGKNNFAGALLRLFQNDIVQPRANEEVEKMLDRYETMISNYAQLVDSLQNRVAQLEAYISSNNGDTREGDPKNLNVKELRKNP